MEVDVMIENLQSIAPGNEIVEGVFQSKIFQNELDDRLCIYLRNASVFDYAERCIAHFNSMSDELIDQICKNLIKSSENDSPDEEYELPELENVRDILKYCWFTSLTVDIPQTDEVAYTVEGEGEWGECVGFIIRNGKLLYVGVNFEDSPWEDEAYYQELEGNCLYL